MAAVGVVEWAAGAERVVMVAGRVEPAVLAATVRPAAEV